MSVGSVAGVAASAAGTQLAQTTGSQLERADQDRAAHARRMASDQQALEAAGVAETDGKDLETGERDADGRLPWEIGSPRQAEPNSQATSGQAENPRDSGQGCGARIDLTG